MLRNSNFRYLLWCNSTTNVHVLNESALPYVHFWCICVTSRFWGTLFIRYVPTSTSPKRRGWRRAIFKQKYFIISIKILYCLISVPYSLSLFLNICFRLLEFLRLFFNNNLFFRNSGRRVAFLVKASLFFPSRTPLCLGPPLIPTAHLCFFLLQSNYYNFAVCGGRLTAESSPGHIYSHATFSDSKYGKSQVSVTHHLFVSFYFYLLSFRIAGGEYQPDRVTEVYEYNSTRLH